MVKLSTSRKMRELAHMLNLHKSEVASFNLPCGYTCPMAHECKSMADRVTGRITDGAHTKFRCYGASLEAVFPSVRAIHWGNYETLINSNNMVDTISSLITDRIKVMRIHSFGDFFTKKYFNAWLEVASRFPKISFFGYTKVLPYLKVNRPSNMALVYSCGGKLDNMLTNEPYSKVVKSIADADGLGLPASCQINPADDYNYIIAQKPFALVIHGIQPAKRAA